MELKLKSSFIKGIQALANAITEDKPHLFYNRCFFLFTHPNLENSARNCDLVFSKVSAMKQMRADMGNRVSILNLQSQSDTQDILNFLKQTVAYSHSMKQKCYGKDYVSNLLSKGFDLPTPPPEPTTSSTGFQPSTLGLLALGGGGVIALAGAAAVLLTGGAATPAVAPVMLFAVKSSAAITAPMLVAPLVAAPAVTGTATAIGAIGIGANAAVASTLLYRLIAQRKEKKQEREYEYDVTTGSLEYIVS